MLNIWQRKYNRLHIYKMLIEVINSIEHFQDLFGFFKNSNRFKAFIRFPYELFIIGFARWSWSKKGKSDEICIIEQRRDGQVGWKSWKWEIFSVENFDTNLRTLIGFGYIRECFQGCLIVIDQFRESIAL